MIELKTLTKIFDQTTAVDHVDLTVPAGQICGYLGPNGAGKTTTVKMLTGMLQPSGGSASVCGFDIQKDPLEVKRRIGYVPESGALYQSLTPYEYLQFVGRLYRMDFSELETKITEFIHFFKLDDSLNQRMSSFSKGMKQKVVIISALIHQPEVIILDEPLNGLDANATLLLKQVLRHLADNGKTILYSSHLMDVVERLCDRVVIIDEGKLVADGSVNELKEMTKHSSLEGVFNALTEETEEGSVSALFTPSDVPGESAS